MSVPKSAVERLIEQGAGKELPEKIVETYKQMWQLANDIVDKETLKYTMGDRLTRLDKHMIGMIDMFQNYYKDSHELD